jgi:Ca2+-binding EF-hand superfamily protein
LTWLRQKISELRHGCSQILINQVDKIEFVEFLEVIAKESMETHSTEEILCVFREIVSKGLGYISSDNLSQILNHLDEPLSRGKVEEIM